MTDSKPVIVVEDLEVAYGDKVVLESISFEVLAGEVFVILGGSGSGKTTLLGLLGGVISGNTRSTSVHPSSAIGTPKSSE